jgi:hypothetical protein
VSTPPEQPPATPPLGTLARELGLGVLALIGVALVVAALMIALILLLYTQH